MSYYFEGKTVVITGATGGLGAELSKEYSKYACNLVLTDINDDKLESLKLKLNNVKHENCTVVTEKMDVSNEENVSEIANKTVETFGRVDILINNAGYLHYNNIFDLTVQEWDRVLNVNLRGMFLTTKYFGVNMKERMTGKIVNISSVAAISGVYGGGAYSSSKSGILGITRVLAKELSDFNINVNAVSPGPIDGDFLNKNSDEDGRQMRIEKTLFKRIGEYSDFVKPILFLSSSDADWITGQNLFVDGGYTVQ